MKKKTKENSKDSKIEADLHLEEELKLPDDKQQKNLSLLQAQNSNIHLRKIIDRNYLEYASYVIKDRAIPDINDGLKPVQRRILWSLHRMDDGRFHKVANVIGHCMQFHPHGDQSIYGALIVLANTDYFIEKQGNFGNILTGDEAAAARYIECRLTELARATLFNPDITEFTESYDGRNKEPIFLPCKIPAVLLLGHEGIAPGMTTRIFPHNFKEVLEAQIAYLKGEKYELYPDFKHGGIMDVSAYNDGEGKITLRAKIDIEGRKLYIREIPATTTSSSLIASIEKAANSNKMKIAAINDFTTDKVEIEIIPQRGYPPEKALNALYAYTDCSVTVFSNILVIKENKPEMMKVSQVLEYCTDRLVEYLKRELEIELEKLHDKLHEKTLAQIFIENRIYKRIEECESYEKVLSEVRKGLEKFKKLFIRELTDQDIEKLLAIPIKRISLFDINRNKKDMDDIVRSIAEIEKNLKRIKTFTIKYISSLIEKFAKDHQRKTKIESFEKIDVKEVALNNVKVGWDKKNFLIGTDIKSEETITCNEFDKLLCIDKNGKYKLINIPQKLYVGRLYYFNKYDKNSIFNVIYRDTKTGAYFAKRTLITKFITDKEYNIIPENCKLELINTKNTYIYECIFEPAPRQKQKSILLEFDKVPMRSPKSKGIKITNKKIQTFKFIGSSESSENNILQQENIAEENLSADQTNTKVLSQQDNPQAENTIITNSSQNTQKKEKLTNKTQTNTEDLTEKETKITNNTKEQQKEENLTDNLFELESELISNTKDKKITQSTKIKNKKQKAKSKDNDSDDWGITQPDLGF
ncbi:MAG TPA: DNA topoisomerase IV subunit A [Victivallales bacterium]|nr:DNA topoisomerase IV subunit A [Victivallales bacterium]